MKKIALFGLICAVSATNANAGWFSNLFTKTAEPTTLAEACNTDEITAICPDTVLGDQTLTACLGDNVKSLSKKCAKFVKKSIKENKELILENKDAAVESVKGQVADVKAQKAEMKKSLADKKAAAKANYKAAKQEIKTTAKTIKDDAVETGNAVKEIVK